MSNIHLLRGEWRASVTRARHKSLYIRTLLLSLLVGHHGTEGRHMCLLLRSSSAPAAPRLPFTSAIFTKRHRRDSLRLSPAPPPALSLSLSLSRSLALPRLPLWLQQLAQARRRLVVQLESGFAAVYSSFF
jgi:hypothetical protein